MFEMVSSTKMFVNSTAESSHLFGALFKSRVKSNKGGGPDP